MCGIAGVLNLNPAPPVELDELRRMLTVLRHRGPDGFGLYRDAHVGLGNARLSIIDLSGGDQPIGNEDGTLWIVFNGEIFNYIELRAELEARGHAFTTHCDTEVILHLYEDKGPACLNQLNGQFAIAIWDTRRQELFLARDRLGVRPLFYTFHQNRLLFGSEVKALLAAGARVELSPEALDQVFTYWSVQAPRTIFDNVQQLPPGHYLLARHGQLNFRPYWTLAFSRETQARSPQDYQSELEDLLIDATRLRLRADVPVGAYLSGGLDSAITAAIVRQHAGVTLETFSIAFSNPEFDESEFQQAMARELGTQHHVVMATDQEIGQVFPDVIWHTETPLLRTGPAPMFLLSRLVNGHGLKVVLTGEGADEFLGGYDIFKEMKVRRFWARNPDSAIRPLLLRKLYRDIAALSQTNQAFLSAFFKRDLEQTTSPYYSHLVRWNNAARLRRSFLNLHGPAITEELRPELPPDFGSWEPLAQAQYLEATTFLSPYLLASQGDRVAMAHSVEGRFPFLDYRVVQFCTRLPADLKLHGLSEKWLLKQIGRKRLPQSIWQRRKRPYRAPIQRSFCHAGAPEYVRDLLAEESVRRTEVFNPAAVAQLTRKAHGEARLSEVEEMALAGVLSTQLVHHHFVERFRPPVPAEDIPLKIVDRLSVPESEVSYAG